MSFCFHQIHLCGKEKHERNHENGWDKTPRVFHFSRELERLLYVPEKDREIRVMMEANVEEEGLYIDSLYTYNKVMLTEIFGYFVLYNN